MQLKNCNWKNPENLEMEWLQPNRQRSNVVQWNELKLSKIIPIEIQNQGRNVNKETGEEIDEIKCK